MKIKCVGKCRVYNKHSEDLSPEFSRQIISVRSILKQKISVNRHYSIIDLYNVLVKKHTTFCYNFLVLPVTVASAER